MKLVNKFKKYIKSFLIVQITCTIVSLPILVYWGLPISVMSIVGNFLFLPFLTTFLVISSLIFFTQLLSIPNDFLIYLLNHFTKWWNYFLQFGKKEWLIGFANPKLFISTFFIVLLLVVTIKKFVPKFQIYINTILVVCTLCFFSFYKPTQKEEKFYGIIPPK